MKKELEEEMFYFHKNLLLKEFPLFNEIDPLYQHIIICYPSKKILLTKLEDTNIWLDLKKVAIDINKAINKIIQRIWFKGDFKVFYWVIQKNNFIASENIINDKGIIRDKTWYRYYYQKLYSSNIPFDIENLDYEQYKIEYLIKFFEQVDLKMNQNNNSKYQFRDYRLFLNGMYKCMKKMKKTSNKEITFVLC